MNSIANSRKCILFFILLLSHISVASGNEKAVSSDIILIIDSYTPSLPWSRNLTTPVYQAFAGIDTGVDIYSEHLNMPSIGTEQELSSYCQAFQSKYEKLRPNVILFLGNTSWALLKDQVSRMWPQTTVILCVESMYIGPKDAYLEGKLIPERDKIPLQKVLATQKQVVFHLPTPINENLVLMHQLIPEMDTVIFISDHRHISVQNCEELMSLARTQYPDLTVRNFVSDELATDSLIDLLHPLGKTTGILYQSWNPKDSQQDNSVGSSDFTSLLSYYSEAPLFALDNPIVEENGIVGCSFYDRTAMGDKLTQAIREAFENKIVAAFEIRELGQTVPIINYQELLAADLLPDSCPNGTVYYFKPVTFWQQMGDYLIWMLLVVITVCVLLCLWYAGKAKRDCRIISDTCDRELDKVRESLDCELEKLQKSLSIANQELSAAVDASNTVPWKWDLEKGVIVCEVNCPIELTHLTTLTGEPLITVPAYQYFSKIAKQDKERVKAAYKQLINRSVDRIEQKYRVVDQEGEQGVIHWVEAHAVVGECDKDGKALSLIGSSLIITEQESTEE